MLRNKLSELSAFTLLTGTSISALISINGSCEFGTCTISDLLAPGASTTLPFSFMYTFADTDKYQAIGTIGTANNSVQTPIGGNIQINAANISLTYLGNNTGTASAAFPLTFVVQMWS